MPTFETRNALVPRLGHNSVRIQPAFTLLEAVVALSILSIGLLAVAALQRSTIVVNRTAYLSTVGSMLGQQTMERLISLSTGHPDLAAGNHQVDAQELPDGFQVLWTINDVAYGSAPSPNVKTMRVIVSWQAHGRAQSLSLTTIRLI